MGNVRKTRERLDAGRKQLAEEAWGYVAVLAAEMEQRYGDPGFSAAIAERIVTLIGTYDPAKGASLRTWATDQAWFACRDVGREAIRKGFTGTRGVRPRVVSHEAATARQMSSARFDGRHYEHEWLAVEDPTPEFESDEHARHLLRGLRPEHAAVVWRSVVEGEPLKAIARDLGVSESRASQIRAQALEWLLEAGRTA